MQLASKKVGTSTSNFIRVFSLHFSILCPLPTPTAFSFLCQEQLPNLYTIDLLTRRETKLLSPQFLSLKGFNLSAQTTVAKEQQCIVVYIVPP